MTKRYLLLPIDLLQPGRYQPRRNFEQQGLHELAQSILSQGLIEPLIVREVASNRYEIIAGERRWRAAKLAKLSELPCLIGDYNDQQAAAITLIENIQRQDLNLIEEARGYKRLSDEFRFHQDEIGALVGKSRSHIANILRLLTLCQAVQESISTGQLTLGHARLLVSMPVAQQMFFATEIINNTWSVRTLEEKISSLKQSKPQPEAENRNNDIQRLEFTLSEQLSAPVQIVCEKDSSGVLQIKFFNNDTLAGLLDRLGLRYD